MDEFFKEELEKTKYFMRCDEEHAEYWRGYHKGLHRGNDESFGNETEHQALMSISKDEPDMNRRMRAEGYKAGIEAMKTKKSFAP